MAYLLFDMCVLCQNWRHYFDALICVTTTHIFPCVEVIPSGMFIWMSITTSITMIKGQYCVITTISLCDNYLLLVITVTVIIKYDST